MNAGFRTRCRCSPPRCLILFLSCSFPALSPSNSPSLTANSFHAFSFVSSSVTFTFWLPCFLYADPIILPLQPLTQVWPQPSTTTRWPCWRATVALTRPTCYLQWPPQLAPAAPAPCTWSTCRQWKVSRHWSHTWLITDRHKPICVSGGLVQGCLSPILYTETSCVFSTRWRSSG